MFLAAHTSAIPLCITPPQRRAAIPRTHTLHTTTQHMRGWKARAAVHSMQQQRLSSDERRRRSAAAPHACRCTPHHASTPLSRMAIVEWVGGEGRTRVSVTARSVLLTARLCPSDRRCSGRLLRSSLHCTHSLPHSTTPFDSPHHQHHIHVPHATSQHVLRARQTAWPDRRFAA